MIKIFITSADGFESVEYRVKNEATVSIRYKALTFHNRLLKLEESILGSVRHNIIKYIKLLFILSQDEKMNY